MTAVANRMLTVIAPGTHSIRFTQEAQLPLAENPWHVQEVNDDAGNLYSPSSLRKSSFDLDDGAVSAVQYNKKEWGAVRKTPVAGR